MGSCKVFVLVFCCVGGKSVENTKQLMSYVYVYVYVQYSTASYTHEASSAGYHAGGVCRLT